MNLRTVSQIVMITILMGFFSGCATTTDPSEDGAAVNSTGNGSILEKGDGTSSLGLNDNQLLLDELNNPDSPLSKRTIYFEYDSNTIKPEYQQVLAAHGKFLAEHPSQRMRLEGHTDERGTREYNLALGESRAQSVRQILLLNGVKENQVEVISFGEEQPAVPGEGESVWAQNRRVEFVY